MGLIEKREGLIYLNVRGGSLVKTVAGTKEKKEYPAVEGLICDIKIVEKESFDKKSKYQEMQVEVFDDYFYLVCSPLYKPFTDGLVFSLANMTSAELATPVRISPYYSSKSKDLTNKSTFCSVKLQGHDEPVRWIEGYPKVEEITVKNQVIKDREERNKFIDECIEEIREKIKPNKEKAAKLYDEVKSKLQSTSTEHGDIDDSDDDDDQLN